MVINFTLLKMIIHIERSLFLAMRLKRGHDIARQTIDSEIDAFFKALKERKER